MEENLTLCSFEGLFGFSCLPGTGWLPHRLPEMLQSHSQGELLEPPDTKRLLGDERVPFGGKEAFGCGSGLYHLQGAASPYE